MEELIQKVECTPFP